MTDRLVAVGDDLKLPAAVIIPPDRLEGSTPFGRSLLATADAAAARTATGAARQRLAGAQVVILGDSNVELAAWPEQIPVLTGATVTKAGVGGTRLVFSSSADYDKFSATKLATAIATGDWSAQIAAATTLEPGDPGTLATANLLAGIDWAAVDYLLFAFGTNDFAASIPVGISTDVGSTTVRGAMNHIIPTVMAAHPNLKVAFATPTWRSRQDPADGKDADTTPNALGEWLHQTVDAILDGAARWAVPALDLYRVSGINASTAATYLSDGLHFNEAGSARIAPIVSGFLEAPITSPSASRVSIGAYNIAIGENAQGAKPTGQYNMAFGDNTQRKLTTGQFNTGAGLNVQQEATTGSSNTAAGYAASRGLTTGSNNVHIGAQAGYNPIGPGVAAATTTGGSQVLIGNRAGQGSATQLDNIVAVGQSTLVSGVRGVAIGSAANAAHNDSIALGGNTATTAANQLRLGPRHIEVTEVASAPGVAPANGARLYVKDNGSGKTQLVVIFQSGAEITLATEA